MGETAERWLEDDPGAVLLAVLAVASVADIATTQAALLQGASELSPFGRLVVDHGVAGMALAKVAAAVAVGVPHWFGRRACLVGLAAMTAAAALSNAARLAGLF
jgi:hypothetical protein